MFKFIALVFAVILAVAFAAPKPGVVTSYTGVVSPYGAYPYAASPVVSTYGAAPVVSTYGAAPVVSTYGAHAPVAYSTYGAYGAYPGVTYY